MATVRTRGIDVSYYQGDINWQTVAAQGVDFVILRGGFGNGDVDTKFVRNITGAAAAGIEKIGVYWFSYAHDADSARTEATFCLNTIEPYRQYINLPVWFDWEGASYSYVQRTYGFAPSASQIQDIATAWCNKITEAGYETGIYSAKSNADNWFKISNGVYLWQQLGIQFWYARYGANDETNLFVTPAFEETALAEHPETDFFQFSDVGQMNGINSNRIDLNIRYTQSPTPEPEPEPPAEYPEPVASRGSIEYVEIRGSDRELVGIIDTFNSVIWHSVWFGVGDFEIYTAATENALGLLQLGNYVTRPDNLEVGIIEKINITTNAQDGRMIIASGRFAKSILDRRLIYKLSGKVNTPTILSGNVESEIRRAVNENAISCSFDSSRNIPILELGASAGIPLVIVDESGTAAQKQVSYQNLLEYTDGVLEEYGLSSTAILDDSSMKLQYIVKQGKDRSIDNTDGNSPVIFSKEFDNLSASDYSIDDTTHKTAALIGGEGEGLDRFYSILPGTATGLSRRETWVDASSLNKKYDDENEQEQTYTDAEYKAMLDAQGKQTLAELPVIESFNGTIDITNGNYIYGRDFLLGDFVTVQDNEINKIVNVLISEVTEVQDADGYTIEAQYLS